MQSLANSAVAPLIVGHRGDPSRFEDNTLDGILAAREVADMVEIDVRRTADRVLILSHDPHVGGRTIGDHPVADFPALVRLTDLLAVIGDFPLNLEIKNSPDDPDFDPTLEIAVRVADLARPDDLITSFHWPTVRAAHQVRPDVATGVLVDPRDDFDGALAEARAAGHRVVAPHWSALLDDPAEIVTRAGDLGVNVWTVNDEHLAARLIEAGVNALITDDPGRMRRLRQEQS